MSTEAGADRTAPELAGHGLRLMIAAVAAVAAGLWLNNQLVAFLAPILVVALLQPGSAAPKLGQIVVMPLAIWLLASAIGMLAGHLAERDDVLSVIFALAIFLCLRRDAQHGRSPVIGLVMIVLVMVGTMSANAASIAGDMIDALAIGAFVALAANTLAHAVVPLRTTARTAQIVTPPTTPTPLSETLGHTAILMSLVIYFLVNDKADSFYILVAAVTVLRLPSPAQGAAGLVVANLIGGGVALCAAVLIEATPSSLFGMVLFAAMMICFGLAAEDGGARAALAQGAATTAIILLVLALAPLDGSTAYVNRVVEIAATVAFVILGRALLDAPPKGSANAPA